MSSALSLQNLSVYYRGRMALHIPSLDFRHTGLSAIIGPNGAGKSTLLKAALGLVPAAEGEVLFWGQALAAVRSQVAYVAQRAEVDWDFPISVREVVAMGRYPSNGHWRRKLTSQDWRRVEQAMAQTHVETLADKLVGELSGGQQQRVMLARAVAQEARLLLLDEPLAALDVQQRQHVFALLQALAEQGRQIICVHHQLADLPQYFQHAVLLEGEVVAAGTVHTVLQAAKERGWLTF